jgi:uncharacterized repeat protein (TIGR03803 family)
VGNYGRAGCDAAKPRIRGTPQSRQLPGGSGYTCLDYPPSGNTGTVFSITTGATEQVVHSFNQAPDGSDPVAGLTDVGGTLYGTTERGGVNGVGTVFELTP